MKYNKKSKKLYRSNLQGENFSLRSKNTKGFTLLNNPDDTSGLPAGHSTGFTLQEMIIVCGIVAVLSISVYLLFINGNRLFTLQNNAAVAENQALKASLIMQRELREARAPEGLNLQAIEEAISQSIIFYADITDEPVNNREEKIQYLLHNGRLLRGVAYYNNDLGAYDPLPDLTQMSIIEPNPQQFVQSLLLESRIFGIARAQTEKKIAGGTWTTTCSGDPNSLHDGNISTGVTCNANYQEINFDFGGTYTEVNKIRYYASDPDGNDSLNYCLYPYLDPAINCASYGYPDWNYVGGSFIGPLQPGWNDINIGPSNLSKLKGIAVPWGSFRIEELEVYYTGSEPSQPPSSPIPSPSPTPSTTTTEIPDGARVICQYVVNGDKPVFYYYDQGYTGSQGPMGYPINLGAIKVIKTHLEIDVNSRPPEPYIHETTIQLRNPNL